MGKFFLDKELDFGVSALVLLNPCMIPMFKVQLITKPKDLSVWCVLTNTATFFLREFTNVWGHVALWVE